MTEYNQILTSFLISNRQLLTCVQQGTIRKLTARSNENNPREFSVQRDGSGRRGQTVGEPGDPVGPVPLRGPKEGRQSSGQNLQDGGERAPTGTSHLLRGDTASPAEPQREEPKNGYPHLTPFPFTCLLLDSYWPNPTGHPRAGQIPGQRAEPGRKDRKGRCRIPCEPGTGSGPGTRQKQITQENRTEKSLLLCLPY